VNLLINSNAKRIPLADGSVNCVVTSPPYYGLRDYGTAEWVGGDPKCEHTVASGDNDNMKIYVDRPERDGLKRQFCQKCGAVRVDKQIGLETTPSEYVSAMVQVFREVWRVLRDDGTVWLNLGDSYVSKATGSLGNSTGSDYGFASNHKHQKAGTLRPDKYGFGLPEKNLIGIPWRVAFALQADGWYLRQDIIWHKPNPMPESVKDRCTKAHEYVFLLTKKARYWYDNEAVKEDSINSEKEQIAKRNIKPHKGQRDPGGMREITGGFTKTGVYPNRNKRSVWTVTTKPYAGAHYAVFPPDLIEPCILAGCPPKVCAKCGKPWVRVVEKALTAHDGTVNSKYDPKKKQDGAGRLAQLRQAARERGYEYSNNTKTLGWRPTCECDAGTKPGVVLDPFIGSGTTCMVARKHGRNAIGIDLKFDYLNTNARKRLQYGTFVPIADGINQLTIGGV